MTVIVAIVVLIPVAWIVASFITTYNGLVQVRVDMDSAWSNIDVLLKQRHDELGKLIDAVGVYAGYEQSTLRELTTLRTKTGSGDGTDRMAAENAVSGSVSRLFAVAEGYPHLRASEQYGILQTQIGAIEEQIAHRREFYNAAVNVNNARLAQFPDSLIAPSAGLRVREMFVASDVDRSDVDIRAGLTHA